MKPISRRPRAAPRSSRPHLLLVAQGSRCAGSGADTGFGRADTRGRAEAAASQPDAFLTEETDLIVATVGSEGIEVESVLALVIHAGARGSLSTSAGMGRAGRDGLLRMRFVPQVTTF